MYITRIWRLFWFAKIDVGKAFLNSFHLQEFVTFQPRRERKKIFGHFSRIFLTDRSSQVAKLSASDIRLSVHLPYVGRGRGARGCGMESVSRRVSRGPTAVAGIARSHQCLPSPVARRRPPSTVHPRVRFKSRLRHGGHRRVPQDPRAPLYCSHDPRRSINPRGGSNFSLSTLHPFRENQWIVTHSILLVRRPIYLS